MNLGCIDYNIKFLFLPSVGQINKSGGHQVVRTIGSNVVTLGNKGKPGMQMATMGGKQTIVINKPGGGQQQITAQGGQQSIRTAGGQQLIVMSTTAGGMGGMKTVQQMTTSQAGGEFTFISYSKAFKNDEPYPCVAPTTYACMRCV